jgi:hypothetical protein
MLFVQRKYSVLSRSIQQWHLLCCQLVRFASMHSVVRRRGPLLPENPGEAFLRHASTCSVQRKCSVLSRSIQQWHLLRRTELKRIASMRSVVRCRGPLLPKSLGEAFLRPLLQWKGFAENRFSRPRRICAELLSNHCRRQAFESMHGGKSAASACLVPVPAARRTLTSAGIKCLKCLKMFTGDVNSRHL